MERTSERSGTTCNRTSCLSGNMLLVVWEEGGILIAEFREADF